MTHPLFSCKKCFGLFIKTFRRLTAKPEVFLEKPGTFFSMAGSLWAEMKEGTLISQNKVINL